MLDNNNIISIPPILVNKNSVEISAIALADVINNISLSPDIHDISIVIPIAPPIFGELLLDKDKRSLDNKFCNILFENLNKNKSSLDNKFCNLLFTKLNKL